MSQSIEETATADADLVAAYRYELPAGLIAQTPAQTRDSSRLMALNGDRIEHRQFRDLPNLLRAGDVLVLNDSRVFAARLSGKRLPGGGMAEILLLRPSAQQRYDEAAKRWLALVRPGRKLQRGARVAFGAFGEGTIVGVRHDGLREIEFTLTTSFSNFLARNGRLALPPYIHTDSQEAQERYQTVFARDPGSVAAPTASLHFTRDLLLAIRARGVDITFCTLDIGLATFAPMKTERVDQHRMHSETYRIPIESADAIKRARADGRRVVAAGTTVLRALEASMHKNGLVTAGSDVTNLFVRPGFSFRAVDALITNFHLPQSTLLVLVCAFGGRDRILRAYQGAILREYRFFSFGDAMFVERAG